MTNLKVTSKKYNDKDVLEVEGDVLPVKISVSNIQSMTDEELNSLKVGDVVQKKTGNQKHCYVVTYKEEKHGICLSYVDCGYMETISYDYTDGHWVYNSKDVCEVASKVNPSFSGNATIDGNLSVSGNTTLSKELIGGIDTKQVFEGTLSGDIENLDINSSYCKAVVNYREIQFIFNCRLTNNTENSVSLSSDGIVCSFGVLPDEILEKIYGHSGNKLTEATSNESIAYTTLYLSQPAGVVASANPKYMSLYYRKASKTLAFYLEGGNVAISGGQTLDFEARITIAL